MKYISSYLEKNDYSLYCKQLVASCEFQYNSNLLFYLSTQWISTKLENTLRYGNIWLLISLMIFDS